MWTRTYLILLLLRLYFAVGPSYIHPDENFQGPEIVAGRIFDLPHYRTWEFTTAAPVRSIFPLWPVYSLPMLILKGIWTELGTGDVPPRIIYYTLRILMFALSFVLEDWAIHELVQSPQRRRLAITLVASSYVTWTYQVHTFSNSVETLAVLWSLVMIQRLLDQKQQSSSVSAAMLGTIIAFGVFNRVTFPAYILLPFSFLVPRLIQKPLSLLSLIISGLFTTCLAITVDTYHYIPSAKFKDVFLDAVITPLNSLIYNTDSSNLAVHGLHPHYQHVLVSLPLLLGPAILLALTFPSQRFRLPFVSAISGTLFLSIVPHQEARFLLPVVPLYLSSIQIPRSRPVMRTWLAMWVAFNLILGQLMGTYHQGGVVPAQIWIGERGAPTGMWGLHKKQEVQNATVVETGASTTTTQFETVFWWRTYSPPIYLLGQPRAKESGINVTTVDLMGIPYSDMKKQVSEALFAPASHCDSSSRTAVGLVAPWSSTELDTWRTDTDANIDIKEVWRTRHHLNLDDLDIPGAGVWSTLKRVVGRRGLVIWEVSRNCTLAEKGLKSVLGGDW